MADVEKLEKKVETVKLEQAVNRFGLACLELANRGILSKDQASSLVAMIRGKAGTSKAALDFGVKAIRHDTEGPVPEPKEAAITRFNLATDGLAKVGVISEKEAAAMIQLVKERASGEREPLAREASEETADSKIAARLLEVAGGPGTGQSFLSYLSRGSKATSEVDVGITVKQSPHEGRLDYLKRWFGKGGK